MKDHVTFDPLDHNPLSPVTHQCVIEDLNPLITSHRPCNTEETFLYGFLGLLNFTCIVLSRS